MQVKFHELPDGRFAAKYYGARNDTLNGIEQYGPSPLEAEINLCALIRELRREQCKTRIIVRLES